MAQCVCIVKQDVYEQESSRKMPAELAILSYPYKLTLHSKAPQQDILNITVPYNHAQLAF